MIQRQGEYEDSVYYGRGTGMLNKTSLITSMLGTPKGQTGGRSGKSAIAISQPSEFRQVSAIIDVDIVPETCRRVRLLKHGSDREEAIQ